LTFARAEGLELYCGVGSRSATGASGLNLSTVPPCFGQIRVKGWEGKSLIERKSARAAALR
jgi:hypothetical protein